MKKYDVEDGFYIVINEDDPEYYRSTLCKDGWGEESLCELPKYSFSLDEFVEISRSMVDAVKETAEESRAFEQLRKEVLNG